jgi:hypothetical protein
MKKLFLFLLKKYSKTEEERIEIQTILHEQVCNDYTEQTGYGNVYNSYIEFLMGNPLVNKFIGEKYDVGIQILKGGLENTFKTGIEYIQNEKRFEKFFSEENKNSISEFITKHKAEKK